MGCSHSSKAGLMEIFQDQMDLQLHDWTPDGDWKGVSFDDEGNIEELSLSARDLPFKPGKKSFTLELADLKVKNFLTGKLLIINLSRHKEITGTEIFLQESVLVSSASPRQATSTAFVLATRLRNATCMRRTCRVREHPSYYTAAGPVHV